MPFDSDRQRKAFFAQKGNPKSNVRPSLSGKIANIREKLRLRKERLGRERIEKEKILLEQEKQQALRLEREAQVEMQRERITQQRIKAQKELREVERVRFARTKRGKALAFAKKETRFGIRKLLN